MDDLISRQAAIDALRTMQTYKLFEGDDMLLIDQAGAQTELMLLPPIQPKRGKWILDEDPHDGDCRCSVCLIAIDQMHERHHGMLNTLTGGKWWRFYKFCPNCGADMRGEQDG